MNDLKLNFSLEKVTFEDVKSDRFQKAYIEAFASGPNAHTLPIETDILKKCADTVYDIPIVCRYCSMANDFMSHEEDEVPIGFVKESTDRYKNPISFISKPDGRIFIGIEALLWKKYSGESMKVFDNSNGKKSVSVELSVTEHDEPEDSEKMHVKEFVLEAITVLGDYVKPAVKGANIKLEFAEDKREYLKMAESSIRINNSKEAAISGKWENPRRKLFDPINKASNKEALAKEAYLVNDGDWNNLQISKLKYPHHVVRNGELVLQKDGVIAAFQRASQQGIVEGEVKKHLMRHYKELGMTTENFAEFSMSKDDFYKYFSSEVGEKILESETTKCANVESKDDSVIVDECDGAAMSNPTAECADGACECAVEEHHEDGLPKVEPATDDSSEEEHEEEHEEHEDHEEDHEEEMSVEDMTKKMAEMAQKIEALEADNHAYMEKLSAMDDYEALKLYKEQKDAEEAQRERDSMIATTISEIENRGVSMDDKLKDELKAKFTEFSSTAAWQNYVKARMFDSIGDIDSDKIGLVTPSTKPRSIWDEI